MVVVGNSFSSQPCDEKGVNLELSQGGKGSKGSVVKAIPKSVWTCCVEAVSEYCRVVLDLFPDQYQVCVAAVDEAKCQPINSWRDEDQDSNKVGVALQSRDQYPLSDLNHATVGVVWVSDVWCTSVPGTTRKQWTAHSLQSMSARLTICCALSGPAYSNSVCYNHQSTGKKANQSRKNHFCLLLEKVNMDTWPKIKSFGVSIQNVLGCLNSECGDPLQSIQRIFLYSDGDVKELEKAIVNLVKTENADIKQKQDMARLHIHHCQMVLVNTYSLSGHASTVKDSPLTQVNISLSALFDEVVKNHFCSLIRISPCSYSVAQLSSAVSSVTYSFPATLLLEKALHLAKMHFDLKSTMITGIPMKVSAVAYTVKWWVLIVFSLQEEQAGGSSANYDVELIHSSEAHRDILRAGWLEQ